MRQMMRQCIRFAICIMMIMATPILCANAETTSDVPQASPIAISNMKINKKSFKAGTTMKYSFTITDIGINDYQPNDWLYTEYEYGGEYGTPPRYYGSDTVYLFWKSSKKQYIVHAYNWSEADKEKGQLNISGKISIQKGMKTGTWKLAAIYFEYDEREFIVRDSRQSICEDAPMVDLSALDFKVTKTGKADYKAPTIDLKSLKLSKTKVGKNQKSTFSVKLKDSSKIEEVVCIWDVYDKTNQNKVGDYYNIYRMKYNKKTKRYQCSVKLDTTCERKAQLVGIEVRDIYGNEKQYYAYKYNVKTGKYTTKVSKYYNAYKNMTIWRK